MFYSRSYIAQRLKEEKFRSYRTGSYFSVVLFNPFRLFSADNRSRKKTIQSLIELLDQETRETDIKGWWDRNTVVILLLDTTGENASLVIDKLISKTKANGYCRDGWIRGSSFEIMTFPNTCRSEVSNEDERKEDVLKGPGKSSSQNCHKINSTIRLPDRNSQANGGLQEYQGIIRRCFDIIISVTGLIILSPLFLLCAILIKLDSSGPVFYRQVRACKDGNRFTFLKFRSMQHNADEGIHRSHVRNLMNGKAGLSSAGSSGESSYKLIEDERTTRFGRVLRKTSIDELPQLINVLKGEMTLVGPRPHPVYEVENYNLWYSHRLDVKPGITGLGQVYGRFDTEYEDVYRLDLRYLKRKSLILDLKILLRTILVILSRRGAH
jgi:lipopolysaccharide/colanic/teichoic acid biosynthesis glycosyltransferase